MDAELRWFASLPGEVRGCQVQRNRFIAAVDGLPRKLVLWPVKSRIRKDLHAAERPARKAATAAMKSQRYQNILAVLRRWAAAPPNCAGPGASRSVRSEPSGITSTSRTCSASIRTPRSPSRPCAGWAPRWGTLRGEDGFTFGMLCARGERIAHDCRRLRR